MYRSRNFAMTQLVMLVIGAALYSTTVMIPQFLQEVMGYTATEGRNGPLLRRPCAHNLCCPSSASSGQKVDPRELMITVGFILVTFGIWRIADLSLNISFWDAASWRVIMVLGMPFLFVPISVMSYVGVPQEKNNEVSGLTALARNIGGSLGISFISTMLVRRAQVHQQFLAAHIYPGSPSYSVMQGSMSGALHSRGFSSAARHSRLRRAHYGMMRQQASTLAYIDTVHMLVILTAVLIPIGYLMKKPRYRPKNVEPLE